MYIKQFSFTLRSFAYIYVWRLDQTQLWSLCDSRQFHKDVSDTLIPHLKTTIAKKVELTHFTSWHGWCWTPTLVFCQYVMRLGGVASGWAQREGGVCIWPIWLFWKTSYPTFNTKYTQNNTFPSISGSAPLFAPSFAPLLLLFALRSVFLLAQHYKCASILIGHYHPILGGIPSARGGSSG